VPASILPRLGQIDRFSNARATTDMGQHVIAPQHALRATTASLIERRRV
jgi:hypothetical protein